MNKYCFWILVINLTMLNAAIAQQRQADSTFSSFETVVPMADGILLSTHVYLPAEVKNCAAVLIRTPYNKESEMWIDKRFLAQGIAIVIQDVRGKFKSQGEFYPFANERSDGLQTLRWIRQQPWSNGIVGGWGVSYMGYTQWAIADSLDCAAPLMGSSNIYDFVYPDGLFSLQSAFLWGYANAVKNPADLSPEKVRARLSRLPLSVADDSIAFLSDWLNHETKDNYWEKINFHGPVNAPLISVAGWYDIFLKGQLNDFQALSVNGNSRNRFIIGPWAHGLPAYKNDYGGDKKTGSYGEMLFRYTLNILNKKNNELPPVLKDTKFNLFIMEKNEYVGSDIWPPHETKMTAYFLRSDQSLSDHQSRQNKIFSFAYDPSNPYPNYGGTFLGDSVGPSLQNRNLERKDQAIFETPVIKDSLVLLGPITATLWLSSSASCTDFIVCLQDLFPDGKIINIQEGGVRASFSGKGPEKKDISVWATGYQLNPGHKLRTVITSSWFPRFNRSLNSCDPIYNASNLHSATQKIYVGKTTPSCIHLPVYGPR